MDQDPARVREMDAMSDAAVVRAALVCRDEADFPARVS